jgi:formaldehyde-activating enzyme involved in methanogenesis
MLIFNKIKKIRDMRDMNVLDRFCAVVGTNAQVALAEAVAKMTRDAIADGFEVEDVIACLSYMVEAEAEVTADEIEHVNWSDSINHGLGLDNLKRRHQ